MTPILIYLLGSIICYIVGKKAVLRDFGRWTTGDRVINIGKSLFSWVGVFSYLMMWICDTAQKNDKPAKW